MKKYKEIMYFGYYKTLYSDGDIVKKYFINNKRHGCYYWYNKYKKTLLHIGYYNMNMEYSHWKEVYTELKYFL